MSESTRFLEVKDLTIPANNRDLRDMAAERSSREVVLHAGNLATPRRTVLGVLAHIARLGMPPDEEREFLLGSGLPPIAVDQPDIPITLEQELTCMARIVGRLHGPQSAAAHAMEIGLDSTATNFGTLGLAMMYAENTLECARVIVSYPELCWGHSRIAFVLGEQVMFQSFTMDPYPELGDVTTAPKVREYLLTVDLTASIRIYADVFGPRHPPTEVWLPFPAPDDHRRISRRLRCPVRYDAPEARIYFQPGILEAKPLLANPLAFRAYERLTAHLARLLRTDVELSEQVRRLLWMSAPPPDRDTVASMLAMSPRTLARKLAAEGTSYAKLQRTVRLARAQEYLGSKDMHLSEVAHRLGFSDATAFSRAFRTWLGESPSTWRRRHHGTMRDGRDQ